MRLLDLINARDSLQKLVAQDLPIRKAYELMMLTDECNRHLNFYGNEIGKFDPEKDLDRLDELNNMEILQESDSRIQIAMDGDLRLSATDVKLLLPLIDFTDTKED